MNRRKRTQRAQRRPEKSLADEHTAQILGYLKSTRTEHGLLVNFGSYKFEIRKYALSQASESRAQESSVLKTLLFVFSAFFCSQPIKLSVQPVEVR
jgi:hypothetical protein